MRDFKLRPWREDDAEDFYQYACHTGVTKHMRDDFPATRAGCEALVRAFAQDPETEQCCRAVEMEGRAVGCIGLFLDGHGDAELAYWLGEPFWRQGIMTAVIRAFCSQAFQRYPVGSIYAEPYESNTASRRTLERAGFSLAQVRARDCIYSLKRT